MNRKRRTFAAKTARCQSIERTANRVRTDARKYSTDSNRRPLESMTGTEIEYKKKCNERKTDEFGAQRKKAKANSNENAKNKAQKRADKSGADAANEMTDVCGRKCQVR